MAFLKLIRGSVNTITRWGTCVKVILRVIHLPLGISVVAEIRRLLRTTVSWLQARTL